MRLVWHPLAINDREGESVTILRVMPAAQMWLAAD